MTFESSDKNMNDIDQRATAFVFGELVGDEAIAFMKEMNASPELQATVASIREAVGAVELELASETTGVSEADRRRIEIAMTGAINQPPPTVINAPAEKSNRGLIALVLAASVLLIGGLTLPGLIAPQGVTTSGLSEHDVKEMRNQIKHLEDENEVLMEQLKIRQQTLDDNAAPELEELTIDLAATGTSSGAAGKPTGTAQPASLIPSRTGQATGIVSPSPLDASVPATDPFAEPSSERRNFADEVARGSGEKKQGAADLSAIAADRGNKGSELSRTVKSLSQVQQPVREATKEIVKESEMMEERLEFDMSPEPAAEAPLSKRRKDIDSRVAPAKSGQSQQGGSQQMLGLQDEYTVRGRGGENSASGGASADAFGGRGPGQTVSPRGLSVGSAVKARRTRATNGLGTESMGMGGMAMEEMMDGMDEMDGGIDAMGGGLGGMGFGLELNSGDRFEPIEDNPFKRVEHSPLSTFSIDVDTAAYSKVRMYLMQHNQLPRPDAVRIEELVNYFDYDYAPPQDEHPFAAAMEVADCPWNPQHRLARIGIKGKVIDDERPASNLVFLLDVSGSMNQANKLPLVIDGMKMLVEQLNENDSVAIVVYAGAAGLVLDSTTGDQTKTIVDSLSRLKAGGSTNGGQGIQLAYQIARDHFIVGGTNRVILCSDGDFNVGVTGTDALVKIAADNAKGNIFLSVLGFGSGNHNDAMMEQISNKGNGNYAFIDTQDEARKVLVEQMQGTLVTIAKDVKIQVEFNPAEVAAYRLIGYENRILAAEDFNDDKKDAGEIGAGHTVTALYEIKPTSEENDEDTADKPKLVDDFRYQQQARLSKLAKSGELLTLKLRYKQPTGTKSTLIQFPVKDNKKRFSETDQDFQFAASVAAFGMLLRNSPHKAEANFDMVEEIAVSGAKDDKSGYRSEFVEMVKKAKQLRGE